MAGAKKVSICFFELVKSSKIFQTVRRVALGFHLVALGFHHVALGFHPVAIGFREKGLSIEIFNNALFVLTQHVKP